MLRGFLQDGVMQCRFEPPPELVYSSHVICHPLSFNVQVFKLCNEVLQLIPLHFYFEELLVSVHLFVSVGKCAPEVSLEDLLQNFIVQSEGTISRGEPLHLPQDSPPPVPHMGPSNIAEWQGHTFQQRLHD